MDYLYKAQSVTESGLAVALANPYAMAVLKITLALYAAQLAPKAPVFIQTIFQNTFVKLLGAFLILYLGEKDFQLSLLIAIIYVLGMNLLSGRGLFESFANYSDEYKSYGNFKLIEPESVIYPGCNNVTMDDLYKMFEGDKVKLEQTVHYTFQELMRKYQSKGSKEALMKIAYAAGLPFNMSFDKPETAPYIATLLVNYGFVINDKCQPPR
jgi:hypothetical protein